MRMLGFSNNLTQSGPVIIILIRILERPIVDRSASTVGGERDTSFDPADEVL